jgi:hypothetical protein
VIDQRTNRRGSAPTLAGLFGPAVIRNRHVVMSTMSDSPTTGKPDLRGDLPGDFWGDQPSAVALAVTNVGAVRDALPTHRAARRASTGSSELARPPNAVRPP